MQGGDFLFEITDFFFVDLHVKCGVGCLVADRYLCHHSCRVSVADNRVKMVSSSLLLHIFFLFRRLHCLHAVEFRLDSFWELHFFLLAFLLSFGCFPRRLLGDTTVDQVDELVEVSDSWLRFFLFILRVLRIVYQLVVLCLG